MYSDLGKYFFDALCFLALLKIYFQHVWSFCINLILFQMSKFNLNAKLFPSGKAQKIYRNLPRQKYFWYVDQEWEKYLWYVDQEWEEKSRDNEGSKMNPGRLVDVGHSVPAFWTNTFSNFDKHIWQFGQTHLAFCTNTFHNMDKSVLQFGQNNCLLQKDEPRKTIQNTIIYFTWLIIIFFGHSYNIPPTPFLRNR